MGFDNHNKEIDAYVVQLIKYKARQLVGQVGFTESDREDLEQEMIIDLLRRLPKYNPDRTRRNTFIARLVDHKIATLIRHRKQQKRDYRREVCSLDEPIEDLEGGTVSLGQTISQDEFDLRMGKHSRPEADRSDLRLDVSIVLSELRPDLRRLAELLMTGSITEAARELGVPRSTLYGTGITRLRKVFEDKDLKKYL